jgi:class I lanthipeptide synthase
VSAQRAMRLAEAIADHLADPNTSSAPVPSGASAWWHQSLARGAPGIALLHIALAAADRRPWQRVHTWLAATTSRPVICGPDSHPMHGAPALAYAVAFAAVHRPDGHAGTLARLNTAVEAACRQRLATARRRLASGGLPHLSEFDAIRGLTGFGAYLLHHHRTSAVLPDILTYLVRLTEPVTGPDGEPLPGWWTPTGPHGRPDPAFPGGHGNLGVAHGIAGPLALLAATTRHGIRIDGHTDAITRICTWLDRWHHTTQAGTRWPYWITHERHIGTTTSGVDLWRPSWCYGVAGIARAVQLAAIATDTPDRQQAAEAAALAAFTDPQQQAAIEDTTLCHGHAGLAHLACRIAADSSPPTAARLREHAAATLEHVFPATSRPADAASTILATTGAGLLDGAAGTALAVLSLADLPQPITGWDTLLTLT